MSNSGHHFRTVAFGGFNKQDVLNYITSSNREFQERDADLVRSAAQARSEAEQLSEKYEEAEAARKKNAAECERMSESLTERTIALEQAQRELNSLTAEHETVSARLAQLEEILPRLEADSKAYSELKDHTATIEMEAHRKAQEIVEQAQARADQLRSELEGWLRRVQGAYQHLRGDLSATISHLSGELERGQKALGDACVSMRQHDEAMLALLEQEHVLNTPRVPEPLPLDEDVTDCV